MKRKNSMKYTGLKKPGGMILILLIGFLLCCFAGTVRAEQDAVPLQNGPDAGAGETAEELPEWTVMLYFCGADLESDHGFASMNLADIRRCVYPQTLRGLLANALGEGDGNSEEDFIRKINVLVETGGSERWHPEISGVEINPGALQRWSYRYEPGQEDGSFTLEEELPLRSMADPDTLADFIRWGRESCPAKKYALVLWGHGDGAKTGILSDELFDRDIMTFLELRQAMDEGGIFFETVVMDACMMANLEAAVALKDHAAWMIASEELVPGRGTALREWLQELYNWPEQDGRQLGRNICDMTEIFYSKEEDEHARDLVTWSLIDLSRIQRLADALEQFFASVHEAYLNNPYTLSVYISWIYGAQEFGDSRQEMRDIFSEFYEYGAALLMDLELRTEILDALSDAVVYCVRGSARTECRGLSLCYAATFTPEELDIYASNCPSARYLALLDAITPWTAPDWVYEQVERLPEINTLENYQLTVERKMSPQGVPGFVVPTEYPAGNIHYALYREDEEREETYRLGETVCRVSWNEEGDAIWSATDPWLWPSIDGEFCEVEIISSSYDRAVYNVPIQVGSDLWFLRFGRDFRLFVEDMNQKDRSGECRVYGLWEGYEDNNVMMCRNVKSLAQLAGQEFRLLYPAVDPISNEENGNYIPGKEQTLYRALNIEENMLPPGTYYLEYTVGDMFMRPMYMTEIKMYWDGKELSFPDGFTWEGTETLVWEGDDW